eukprot:364015-Chlamydomonas_euryale.AAC.4
MASHLGTDRSTCTPETWCAWLGAEGRSRTWNCVEGCWRMDWCGTAWIWIGVARHGYGLVWHGTDVSA